MISLEEIEMIFADYCGDLEGQGQNKSLDSETRRDAYAKLTALDFVLERLREKVKINNER